MTSPAPPVLIIGAGPSGLTTAHFLREAGVSCVILEAGDRVGQSFFKMRDGLRLISPKAFCELPGLPLPPGLPDHIPMRMFQGYLEDLAAATGAPVQFGVQVDRVMRESAGFRVTAAAGNEYWAPVLVVATGVFSTPHLPEGPAWSGLSIPRVHSRDVGPASTYRGQSVLVVGSGLSAQEICLDLMQQCQVTLSARRPLKWFPESLVGIDVHWLAALPERIPVRWMPWLVPLQEPLPGDALIRAIAARQVTVVSDVRSVEGDRISFTDGSDGRFDSVVFATGYRPTVDFLGDLWNPSAGPLASMRDGASTKVPDLWFVGFPYSRTFGSRFLRGIREDARHVARSIAARLSGSS